MNTMNIIESERKELPLGLPAGSWWRLHWTLAGAAAGAGRHQRSSQHGARQAREEGDSYWGWAWPWAGTATTTQPWHLGHPGTVLIIHIHMHINMHIQTRINLNALFLYWTSVNFFAKHVFPSVTSLAKLLQTFMHFRLRLCFLVVVPFNLNCKQQ